MRIQVIFSNSFFTALNNWQNGWKEDQERRSNIAEVLKQECQKIPKKYRQVKVECYRKRFLQKGEFVDIILNDQKDEGVTSWTTNINYAERFKGLIRESAVTAAIFAHHPNENEVILDISSLWSCSDFVNELEAFEKKQPQNCKAIYNFQNRQSEVVLEVPLKGSDIIALTGISSPFDDLCDKINVPEEKRDQLFKKLIDEGAKISEITYIKREKAQRAIGNVIKELYEKVERLNSNF